MNLKLRFINLIIRRQYSLKMAEPLPVIRVPKYLVDNKSIRRLREKQKKRESINENLRKGDPNICIISSNFNNKLNHNFGQTYSKQKEIPLISKSWMKSTSVGLYFLKVLLNLF